MSAFDADRDVKDKLYTLVHICMAALLTVLLHAVFIYFGYNNGVAPLFGGYLHQMTLTQSFWFSVFMSFIGAALRGNSSK